MKIETYQYHIKDLFRQHPTFQIPKYQRGYAWDEDAIEDFIKDLSRCLEKRKNGNPEHHFSEGL